MARLKSFGDRAVGDADRRRVLRAKIKRVCAFPFDPEDSAEHSAGVVFENSVRAHLGEGGCAAVEMWTEYLELGLRSRPWAGGCPFPN
jgi:hypothetical protein